MIFTALSTLLRLWRNAHDADADSDAESVDVDWVARTGTTPVIVTVTPPTPTHPRPRPYTADAAFQDAYGRDSLWLPRTPRPPPYAGRARYSWPPPYPGQSRYADLPPSYTADPERAFPKPPSPAAFPAGAIPSSSTAPPFPITSSEADATQTPATLCRIIFNLGWICPLVWLLAIPFLLVPHLPFPLPQALTPYGPLTPLRLATERHWAKRSLSAFSSLSTLAGIAVAVFYMAHHHPHPHDPAGASLAL
ncbi:hypothetical protein HETIRDRAFT_430508 [Heterobasidion irregulare TC 32-1]|uniref:Uncharacterized protein n=1 Tax=Heterobasidion irregulare (strain TC 32-1) TaxID=747525 RepID=W4JRP1_HETIT|nr:uncharacterized protein HETIRDRAFT_430508 [Heterobasidion irregulare TC 32-1]ETW76134.1 hypothetical protein HETIRDRAFT_430508 [Heterobasidion irregulare TC 32-1]